MSTENFKFNERECIEARDLLKVDWNITKIWHDEFAPSRNVGNCSYLYSLHDPDSVEEFFEKYIGYAKRNKSLPVWRRGRTMEELQAIAEKYRLRCSKYCDYDTEVFLKDIICHVIVETWYGNKNERDFMRYLESVGYNVSKFDGKTDTEYGVDIKYWKDGDDRCGAIQIKPISFFVSKRADVVSDRMAVIEKYRKAKEDLNLTTRYAIYRSDKETGSVKWMRNEDGGFCFRLKDLFSVNGSEVSSKELKYEFCQLQA